METHILSCKLNHHFYIGNKESEQDHDSRISRTTDANINKQFVRQLLTRRDDTNKITVDLSSGLIQQNFMIT